jgi:hypothetical protein
LIAFFLTHPSRLVLDITDATLAKPEAQSLAIAGGGISRIRVAQFQRNPGIVRLVCDLSTKAPSPWRQTAGSRPGEILLQFGKSLPTPWRFPNWKALPA